MELSLLLFPIAENSFLFSHNISLLPPLPFPHHHFCLSPLQRRASMNLLLTFSLLLLLISSVKSQNADDIKAPLIGFLHKLSLNNPNAERNLNWTASSDPCLGGWQGISCDNLSRSLRSINLESLNLSGFIDGELLSNLCNSSSLSVLNLNSNSLAGRLPPEISSCLQLTNLFLRDNRLSGNLPSSLPNLGSLKKLDISNNNFSGDLPWNLSYISGLDTFLANNNGFTGTIPAFDLNYFNKFNVSFNQLSGPVPLNSAQFPLSSFDGNSGLCGKPLEVSCPPRPPPSSSSTPESKKRSEVNKVVLFSGYVLLGLALVLLFLYLLMKKKDRVITRKRESSGRKLLDKNSDQKPESSTSPSEYSISSPQSAAAAGPSAALTVLSKDERRKDLKFEDLLRAPAELMRKGSFGSLYMVAIDGGETELVVKRIRDSTLTGEEFRKRIMRIDQGTHPNVLPVTALFSSKQEKLVVYDYQKNGSLFKLLHGENTLSLISLNFFFTPNIKKKIFLKNKNNNYNMNQN